MGAYSELKMAVKYPGWTNMDQSDSPFGGFTSKFAPRTRKAAFKLGEHVWNNIAVYRQGILKVISYFMTELDIQGVSSDRVDVWADLLNQDMDVLNVLKSIAADYMVYGNSFTSIFLPFRRYLVCPKCRTRIRGEKIDYVIKDDSVEADCPQCTHRGEMDVKDRKIFIPRKINVIRWNPHEIDLKHNEISGDSEYIWKIPGSFRSRVAQGDKFFLDTTPINILKAAARGEDLKLTPHLVHHVKFDHLAGTKAGGWGIPPIMASFSQLYYVQLLKRFQQKVAVDYMFPVRVLSPGVPQDRPATGQDPVRSFGRGLPKMTEKLARIVQQIRRDPTSWVTAPFPIQEGTLGGEGVTLINPELLTQGVTELLNGIGVPMEFYQGNMRWRGNPQAIRLLEKNWEHLVSSANSWVNWATDIIALGKGWEQIDAHLKPPSMFDNPARKQLLLQLAMEGRIPLQMALEGWDIDLDQAREDLMLEKKKEQRAAEEMQREQASELPMPFGLTGGQPPEGGPAGAPAAMGGAPAAMGGAPAMGAGPTSVSELNRKAQQMAEYFLTLPAPIRESQLEQLGNQNKTLHHVVQGMMENMRQQADRQGSMMAREQLFGAM